MIVTICSRAEDGVSLNRRTFEMNFVDLAGSERPDKIALDESKVDMRQKVKAQAQQAQLYSESLHINGSLSTLGRVIAALAKGSPHVPFRESKLTSLLRHALGSNGLLLFIACVAANNIPETTRTLQFASQARTIRVVASPVLDANTALIAQLRARIKELEGDLAAALAMNENNNNTNNSNKNNKPMTLLASSTTNEYVAPDDDEDDDEQEFDIKQSKSSSKVGNGTLNNHNNNSEFDDKQKQQQPKISNGDNSNNRESVLSHSLFVACTKMQDLLRSNANLRSQIDSLHGDQDNVSERLSELERENLNLREKLDILSSVVSVEAKTTESLLRAAVHGNSNFTHHHPQYSSSSSTIYGKFITSSSPRTKSSTINPNKTKSKQNTNGNGHSKSASSPSSFIVASHPSLIPPAPVKQQQQQLPPLSSNTSGRRSTGASTPMSNNNNGAATAAVGLPLSLFGGGAK